MTTSSLRRALAPTQRKKAEVTVACDGSCLKNPGGATGWAWVASDGRWAAAGMETGTNQVAELWGVLSVLRDFPHDPLVIQIDSEYAMKAATVWGKSWARSGWRTREGTLIKNITLVKGIFTLMAHRTEPVRFVKVPGHDPQGRWPLNTAADRLAGRAARLARTQGEKVSMKGLDKAITQARVAEPSRAKAPTAESAREMCNSCGRRIAIDGRCGCFD